MTLIEGRDDAGKKKKLPLAVEVLAAIIFIIVSLLWFANRQDEDAGDYFKSDVVIVDNLTPVADVILEVAPEPEDDFDDELQVGPVRGVWNGNIWTSEYIGLYFYLPKGWEFASDVEIADMLGFDAATVSNGVGMAATDEFWEMAVLYDLWAFDLETATAVSVLIEKMPDLDFGVEEFIEYNARLILQFETDVNTDVEPRQIGGFEWAGIEFYSDAISSRHNNSHFVRVVDGFAVVILVQTFDDYGDTVDNFLQLFGCIGDAPEPSWEPVGSIMWGQMMDGLRQYGLEKPDAYHPLVGTWEWDLDGRFVYSFFAGGNGTRGFGGETESFLWGSSGDHLVIRLLFMDESWTFAISGDLLTIDSRQVAGLAWRYFRQ